MMLSYIAFKHFQNQLSDFHSNVKNFASDVPWKNIAGFRNILVHQYLGDIDPEIIWQVIKYELPKLHKSLSEYKNLKLN